MKVSSIRATWLLRMGITGGIVLLTAIVVIGLFRYPMLLALDGADIYLGLYAFTAVGYLILVWGFARPHRADGTFAAQQGLLWGSILSILWLIEIISGNFGDSHLLIIDVVYFGAVWAAFLLPILAGFLAARQTGRSNTGALVGLWAGLIDGLCACLALSAIGLFCNTTLQHDPQTAQEFARSGASDIHAFIFGDFLAGGINHLWLVGPLLGTLTGALGGLIGAAVRQQQPKGEMNQR